MAYLISQIIFCLIAAAVLGMALGWLLHGLLHHHDDMHTQLNDCLEDNRQLRLALQQANALQQAAEEASTGPGNNETKPAPKFIDQFQADVMREPRLLTMLEDSDLDSYDVTEIEGIGKGYSKRLNTLGISNTQELLLKAQETNGTDIIAENTKVENFVVEKWLTQADLLRIPGIRGQFAELLQASEVNSCETLAKRNAEELLSQLHEVNEREHRSPVEPTQEMLKTWIDSAGKIS